MSAAFFLGNPQQPIYINIAHIHITVTGAICLMMLWWRGQNSCQNVPEEANDKVKCWLSDAGHPYAQSNDDEQPPDNLIVASDGIHPEDSVSNVSCQEEKRSRAHSNLSKASSTSSARIKTEADKAALIERMAALESKHALEAKEEKLWKNCWNCGNKFKMWL